MGTEEEEVGEWGEGRGGVWEKRVDEGRGGKGRAGAGRKRGKQGKERGGKGVEEESGGEEGGENISRSVARGRTQYGGQGQRSVLETRSSTMIHLQHHP